MNPGGKLSVAVLGRITLLQSMVTLMPNQKSMLEFICQGLKDVSGVKNLTYRLLNQDTSSLTDTTRSNGVIRVFPVKYDKTTYAELNFEIAKAEDFEPYVPFLTNFANMLAVIFEGQAQKILNNALMAELEQRVTERTRELQETGEDLRITLDSIGDAVISTDIHGKITKMNPVAESLTGWKEKDGSNKSLTDVFRISNTLNMQQTINPVERVLATGEIVGLANHTTLTSKGGTQYQIADSAAPICDVKGRIRGVVLVFRDVTAEYQAAEAVKISEEKYRKIVEETSDLVTTTNEKGEFTFVNHCAEKIFGLSAGQCFGKVAFDFIHPDDREKSQKWFTESICNRIGRDSFENRQVNQVTHEVFHLLWTCNFHYDSEGRLLQVNGVAHDITMRKQAEEEKYRLETQLAQAQKMESIGHLAGGVAHDFNNMLGVILGHAEIAMMDLNPSTPLYLGLEEICKAANHSAEITKKLLAFARKQTFSPKVIDLNQTIEGMLKMIQRLIGENIEFIWLPGARLWPVKVDPSQIDQILANLCVNSRDAIEGVGKITVTTGNRLFDKDYCDVHTDFLAGKYVWITVYDNGCGMDKETLTHIFEPFFTTKGVGRGTGLGLATVYGTVKQNNGFISVYSESGHGTTITIYLPCHLEEVGDCASEKVVKLAAGGHENILLVEDEVSILKMTTTMLERLGYAVLAAGTPHEALQLASQHSNEIHLVITDVVMPEMNGRELAKKLLEINPHIKCLFMSGYTSDIIASQGILDSGVQFIQKPFSNNDLAAKVRMVLKKNKN